MRHRHRARRGPYGRRRWAVLLLGIACCGLLCGADDPPPFRVALTGKYKPFSMYDADGKLVGFDVDVSRAVAAHLGRELELVPTEWAGILPGLLAGNYDAIIGSMAITEERRRQVDFSVPYYRSGAQLFVHRRLADQIGGIEDCAGRRIGVGLGETYEHYLREHHPEVVIVAYKGTPEIFRDMANGRIDGFVSDRLVGAYQIKTENMPFVPAGSMLYRERIGIPVRKGETELLHAIDAALDEMEASGEFVRLHDNWFGLEAAGSSNAMRAATVVALLAKGFGLTLLVAALSIAIGFVLAVPGGIVLNSRGAGRFALRAINDFIRGTPVLIQLFFVYFGVCALIYKQTDVFIPAWVAAVFTLGINASAYMAEVVRSGLMAVPAGQREAARALGLTRLQTFRLVVWPQAFRIALPPLMNSVVALIKDTALVSAITVAEVVRQADAIISVTFEPSKYYFIVAVMFFVVTFPLMKLAGRLEERIRQRGFAT